MGGMLFVTAEVGHRKSRLTSEQKEEEHDLWNDSKSQRKRLDRIPKARKLEKRVEGERRNLQESFGRLVNGLAEDPIVGGAWL